MEILMALIFGGIALGVAFRYPSQTFKTIGGLVLLAAIGIGVFLSHENKKQAERVALEKNIEVSVAYNLALCGKDYPLFLSIHNKNKAHRLSSIALWPEARQPGRSSNQWNEPGYTMLESDYIVEPDAGIGNCYRLPEGLDGDPASLQFSVKKGWAVIDPVAAK